MGQAGTRSPRLAPPGWSAWVRGDAIGSTRVTGPGRGFSMLKTRPGEVPPPGAGLWKVTAADPAEAMRPGVTVAVSFEGPTKVVGT